MSLATVNLARFGKTPTVHHVVGPKPLPRGDVDEVRTRCGRTGKPTALVRKIDARAVRVREGVVCVNCIDLSRLH